MAKHDHSCSLCDGKGYHDIVTGGSETCPACKGTGKSEKK